MQVKLLRAIQEKTVRPVGSHSEIRVDVRILSATHRDLHELLRDGRFRQDLYYRLNVIQLCIPSLRERPEDIPLLADYLCAKLTAHLGGDPPRLAPDAVEALTRYDFPGNVRELENILERAITLCDGNKIIAHDLELPQTAAERGADTPAADGSQSLDDYLAGIEERTIRDALARTHHNKTAAAKLLGITFRALRYKLEKLGIE